MKKTYLKPVSEKISAETIEFIAHSLDEMDGKENTPDNNDGEGDIWNLHYNVWD